MKEIEVYRQPIEEGFVSYNVIAMNAVLDDCSKRLYEIVQRIREELEISANIRPVEIPLYQRKQLWKRIKNNKEWKNATLEIVNDQMPNIIGKYSPEDIFSFVYLPDWVDPKLTRMNGCNYSDGKLHVDLEVTHSYPIQIVRNKDVPPSIIDPPSVSGITITTKDEKEVLLNGVRGGGNLPNTLMTVPAGSIKIIPDGDSIFDTYHKTELSQELGLTKEDLESSKIEGRVFDPYIGRNSLFVIAGRSKLTYEEILERWDKKAKDRGEHKGFILTVNDSDHISEFLDKHDLPHTSGYPEVPEDQMPLLYPAKLSLICHGRLISPDFEYKIRNKQ